MKLLKKLDIKKINLSFATVLFIAAVLRILQLGYSDFQGDEIKALFLPDDPDQVSEFLLTQRKGPVQFLVTYTIKLIDPLYTNQFLVRLPFALAGFFAVYFFYKLVRQHFNEKIAFYASLFLATNGFFVAFARIAQYQSFVILFSILCLYFLTQAVQDPKMKVKGMYLAALFWALSILSHYDGIFIIPAVLMLLVQWLKGVDLSFKPKAKTVTMSFLVFVTLNLLFYVPFAMYLSPDTTDYWSGRLVGDVSDKLSSSYYLFSVYQPIYVIHFYTVLFGVSILALFLALSPRFVKKLLDKIIVVKTAVSTAKDLIIKQITLPKYFTVLFWFAIAWMFWELLVSIPGTHIYTYLLPSFILIAIGIAYIEQTWLNLTLKAKYFNPVIIKNALLAILFTFISLQSYAIFVDNVSEYPWQEEKFLLWTMAKPSPVFHLSMFGFPYFRDWESIGRYIDEHPGALAYSTNERDSISRHYVNLPKDTVQAGYFVYIRFPQSFNDEHLNEKFMYWASTHPPVYTLSRGGLDLVNIYLMPQGPLEEIRLKGY